MMSFSLFGGWFWPVNHGFSASIIISWSTHHFTTERPLWGRWKLTGETCQGIEKEMTDTTNEIRGLQQINRCKRVLTMNLPVLFEHPKRRTGWVMVCVSSPWEVWYSDSPPNSAQKSAAPKKSGTKNQSAQRHKWHVRTWWEHPVRSNLVLVPLQWCCCCCTLALHSCTLLLFFLLHWHLCPPTGSPAHHSSSVRRHHWSWD